MMENDYKPVVRNRILQFQSQIRRETYLQYHHSILLETGMIEGKRYRTHRETRFSSSKLGNFTLLLEGSVHHHTSTTIVKMERGGS